MGERGVTSGWMVSAWTLSVAACAAVAVPVGAQDAPRLTGRIMDRFDEPVPGAMVTARDMNSGVARTAYSDSQGGYSIPGLETGTYQIEARHEAFGEETLREVLFPGESATWDFTLANPVPAFGSGSSFLNLLPAGEEKRRFIIDCTGCHVLDERVAIVEGRPRTDAEWRDAMSLMLANFGQGTGFPIISSHPDPSRDAAWIARALGSYGDEPLRPGYEAGDRSDVVLTEYDFPAPMDLPHDLMVDPYGSVVITGMFTHAMHVLNPETGEYRQVSIPVANANPRALDIDGEGRWWVLLGGPAQLAGYDPRTDEWETFPLGMYPHSVQLDARGRAWYNGHFTVAPELIGSIDTRTGESHRYMVPPVGPAGEGESTIPYGLRVDGEGIVWATQLRGNHLIRLDPESGVVDLWPLPTPHFGPRRLDVGPDGSVWIPAYSGGALLRFDPGREEFTEYTLPIRDALPYVVRVDQTRGTVWIGTGAADAVLSFDPSTEDFTVFSLPTKGALIRHVDVDESTGDLWAAYGASPGIPAKILRIQTP